MAPLSVPAAKRTPALSITRYAAPMVCLSPWNRDCPHEAGTVGQTKVPACASAAAHFLSTHPHRPRSSTHEQCSTVPTFASAHARIPCTPCACAATRSPAAAAQATAMRISLDVKADCAGFVPAVRTPPVAITLIKSAEFATCRWITFTISVSSLAAPPHWWQCPPGRVTACPATRSLGPMHAPLRICSRRRKAPPRPPRSRAVVMP
mmetsp:Transcript_57324/g.124550  ORF Transcript_57324/g.124550 Transcript_57324/m.124550 type:complete len:207 (-) Transcript_57324:672-1292(-)